jgi:hypothetical protein
MQAVSGAVVVWWRMSGAIRLRLTLVELGCCFCCIGFCYLFVDGLVRETKEGVSDVVARPEDNRSED